MNITNTRSIRFMGRVAKADLERFMSTVPGGAFVWVDQDAGGGTQLDPGGTVTITAEWTEDDDKET